MPAIVANAEVEDCLREVLGREGFHLSSRRAHGQTGVDIVASKGDERYHIEIVGYKAAGLHILDLLAVVPELASGN